MGKYKIQKTKLWFLYGCLLGAVCFVLIYGTTVLNFTNDSWIMMSKDPDIKQHYLGWCHFRNTDWGFPFGMIKSLSSPFDMSVIYTDSIPLFAIVFKVFRSLLPLTFQYFGLYGLLSMMLTGGFATLVIKKVNNRIAFALVGPLVFILSPIMLFRMFYHTSLTSQWIILCAIYLIFDKAAYASKYYQRDIWMLFGVLCVLIHIYYLPVIFGLICLASLEKMLSEKKFFANFVRMLGNVFIFGLFAFITMFILGAFSVPVHSSNYGVGEFGANINTFINPLGMSRVIKDMPLASGFQYEGSSYLGLGMLILLIIVILMAVSKIISGKGLKMMFADTMAGSVVIVCIIYLFFSISPLFAFGDRILFSFKYPDRIAGIINVFRSNGRFIWPVFYFVILLLFYAIDKMVSDKWFATALIIACVAIQLFDLSGYIIKKHDVYAKWNKEYTNIWENNVGDKLENYNSFILFTDNNQIFQNVGYYTYLHNMKMNRFYYARDIDEAVVANLENIGEKIKNGDSEKDVVYVFDKTGYKEFTGSNLHFYNMKYIVFGTKNPIDGLTECSLNDLAEKEKNDWK